MPPIISTAFLGSDPDGNPVVSIHVKRTYVLPPSGVCVLAEEQQPFLNGPDSVAAEEQDGAPAAELPPESDVLPFKRTTDLIVMASAHAPDPGRSTEMIASIEVGSRKVTYRIVGDRRVIYRGAGTLSFEPAAAFATLPMRYENAYGGVDPTVENPVPKLGMELFNLPRGIYPRNPIGRGYVVNEDAQMLDGLLLPNIEHPDQLLTPERLISRSVESWWKQPLPWSCDWFDLTWYPRCVALGGLPAHLPDDDGAMAEVRLGFVEARQNQRLFNRSPMALVSPAFGDAASPALVLPFLRGNEPIRLCGLNAGGELVVRLPEERPRMQVRFEGKMHDVDPVLNRLLVSTEEMGVYAVWHGTFPLPQVRNPSPGREEGLESIGIQVFLDGIKLAPSA